MNAQPSLTKPVLRALRILCSEGRVRVSNVTKERGPRGLLDAVQTEIAHNDGRTEERGDMDAAMKVSEQVLAKAKRRGA